MKNKLPLVSLIFLFCTGLYAKEGISFSISPYAGIRWGQQDEFVYAEFADGKTRDLSELNWEQKPVYVFGSEAKVSFKFIELSLGLESALPLKCGTVYDKDWLNYEISGLSDSQYGIQTNLSETENYLKKYFKCNFYFSVKAKETKMYTVKPFLGLEYEYMHFMTRNGWYQYATSDRNGNFSSQKAKDFRDSNGYFGHYSLGEKIYFDSENLMSLERYCLYLWAGFNLEAKLTDRIYGELSLGFNPYVKVESLDRHLLRKKDFYDVMDSYFCGLKANVKMIYKITSSHALYAEFEGRKLSERKGDSYNKEAESKKFYRSNSSSGCGNISYTLYFGYKFTF